MSWIDLEISKWTYDTGATGGLGIEFVAISGGAVYLRDVAKKQHTFYFGSLGGGVTYGFKIPRLPKVQIRGKSIAGVASTKSFYSGGTIWRRTSLGRELSKHDIQGAIVCVEGAIGLGVGSTGDAMLFGINPIMLAVGLASGTTAPWMLGQAINTAKGAMTFGGINAGVQAGAGVAGLVGYMG